MKIYEKIITALFTLLLFVCLFLTGQSVLRTAVRCAVQLNEYAAKQTTKASGTSAVGGICGNHVTWTFADGILTISGKGRMKDYKDSLAPWASLSITTVKVGEGVTSIGSRAFKRNRSLRHVLIPSTLTSIDAEAFDPSQKLPGIYVACGNTHFVSLFGVLFYKASHYPALNPVGSQRISYPFPDAISRITSYLMFSVLYLQSSC